LFGFKKTSTFEVIDFNPFKNFSCKSDTLFLDMDLTDAISKGIIIPSVNAGNKEKYFKFSFLVKNNSVSPQAFYYKIYYQNETYKLRESYKLEGRDAYNCMSSKNFYGSWENVKEQFHKTPVIPNDNSFHEVTDSFRIVGNPRDEWNYYGSESTYSELTSMQLLKVMNSIKSITDWYNNVILKAKINNISVDEQLYLDAMWIVDSERKKGEVNNRWKRNPRVGCYSFMLVVTDEKGVGEIPLTVRNVGVRDTIIDCFMNPYYYYNFSSAVMPDELMVLQSKKVLKTKASLKPEKGVYVDLFKFKEMNPDTSFFSKWCGNSENLYYGAHFEQFFHHINKNFILRNIPVVYDVTGDNYSKKKYFKNFIKYKNEDINDSYISVTKSPGKTVGWDPKNNAIYIKNPGNENVSYPVKENVGVSTRIGFTYGKYRAKIKFPYILSKDNVWNGLTCAFWLLYQDEAKWNYRDICEGEGYIPKHLDGRTDNRVKSTFYSEIDIEIVKTSRYWPKSYYVGNPKPPFENSEKNDNIVVSCTNWDLACKEPPKFNVFAGNFVANGQSYEIFRWDEWYKAQTTKYADAQSNVVGDFIYYEIDWQPDKIIWRIGRSKNDMKVIAWMDNTTTKIPDNQMIAVITQEFHDASWWPLAPWDQNYIPFPKKDIFGYVYELEVE
jgi:hypothetical protein